MENEEVSKFINRFMTFQKYVKEGYLGKTAQFWMSYMEHVELILSLNCAVKTNNFALYGHSLRAMPSLFFTYGGQNYARYITYFGVSIANLDISHPGAIDLIKLWVFSVARSFIPGNRCVVDCTMDETFMKHAKSKGGAGGVGAGLTGITTNYVAY